MNTKTSISLVLQLSAQDAARGVKLGSVTFSHRPGGVHLDIALANPATGRATVSGAAPRDLLAESAEEAGSWLRDRMLRWKAQ